MIECKMCGKIIKDNKHGEKRVFCSRICRNYFNNNNFNKRSGDIFRKLSQRQYAKNY